MIPDDTIIRDANTILVQMLVLFRRPNPSTLYRPCAYVNGVPGRIMNHKVEALLELSSRGYVRLYYLDGKVLGAELTHAGIRRAGGLMK